MGLSHLSMLGAHPSVTIAGICDAAGYVLGVLNKHAGFQTYSDYTDMLDSAGLDAVVIATPSALHAPMVRQALERGLHVFCEKPFVLSPEEGKDLVSLARDAGVVNQIGYHNRFVGTFIEARRLLDASALGTVSHALAEAYGPVVLKSHGSTWRSKRTEGGGCLYDYGAHPLNLVNWYFGAPKSVGGTALNRIFSTATEDEVYGTLFFENGTTAQLSVNWSDDSQRKMTTRISIWGSRGRIVVDRQEIQVYLRGGHPVPEGYNRGWTVRNITELTPPVWFYVRGEEYSAQLDHFVRAISDPALPRANSFESAQVTDSTIDMLIRDAAGASAAPAREHGPAPAKQRRSWFRLAN